MADNNNEEPRKESLDEILSDLNDILKKMPDIVDGTKPGEDASPAAFSQPEAISAAAAGMDASDKTPVIQSLGESMFSGGAEEPAPRPAEPEPAGPEPQAAEPVPALSPVEAAAPPVENKAAGDEPKAGASRPGEALIMDFKADAPAVEKETAAHAGAGLYASTRDFGVPDIDMLLAMSQGGAPEALEAPAPAAEAVAPQAEAAPVQSGAARETPATQAGAAAEKAYAEEIKDIDGLVIGREPARENIQGDAQQEAQPAVEAGGPAAGPPAAEGLVLSEAEGGTVGFNEEDRKKEEASRTPAPAAGDEGAQPGQGAAPEPAGILSFGPEETPAPAPPPEEEKTMVILPSGGQPQAEPSLVLGNAESVPAPQPEEEKTMVILPSGGQPQGELFLAPGSAEPAPARVEPAIVPGGAEPVLELSVTPPSPQPEEEKTMVLLPSGGQPQAEPSLELGNAAPGLAVNAPAPAPEEEKTMMIAPGTDLGATMGNRADLAELSAKAAPESIPENRQRTLALLYVEEDKDLCASVLAELDSICAKSQSKPMFIKRAFVKVCEAGMNGNLVQQMATDAKANGLVCVGAIPQETVYEIENAVSSSGLMFKHVQRDTFSHSTMLDVVTELILR